VLGVIGEWLGRRRALKELRRAQRDDNRDYREFFKLEIEAARHALDRGEHADAVDAWEKVRTRFPGLALKSADAFELVLDLGRFDEAEEMMRDGQRRQPRQVSFPLGYARVAQRRGDAEEAVRRCEALLRRFFDCAEGYLLAAQCLDALGRRDEAEAVLERGAQRLPRDFAILCAHATHAEQRGDMPAALDRWRIVQQRSDHPPGVLGVARCLMDLKCYDEAERVLTEACEHYSTNGYPLISMGRLTALKGDPDEAMRYWKLARDRFPDLLAAFTDAAGMALELGRDAEADEILHEAIERFPYELGPHLTYARAAHRRRDWSVAAERWSLTCERFPTNAEAQERRAEAETAAKASL